MQTTLRLASYVFLGLILGLSSASAQVQTKVPVQNSQPANTSGRVTTNVPSLSSTKTTTLAKKRAVRGPKRTEAESLRGRSALAAKKATYFNRRAASYQKKGLTDIAAQYRKIADQSLALSREFASLSAKVQAANPAKR